LEMIVKASAEDGNDIRRIVSTSDFFSEEEIATVDELWDEYILRGTQASGYYFIVCKEANKVLGFACYGPHPLTQSTYDLYWIITAKDAKGRGVGKALMAQTEKEVAALGGTLLIAETSGKELYLPTRGFYENLGYLKEAVIRDFYAPGDDLVMYTKKVG
jgi:ribosomal protein S18 acetylase RimI-like enzyme